MTSESDLAESVHELLVRVYAINPQVLLHVLPQMSQLLQTEDVDERLGLVQVIGDMASVPAHNFASDYRKLFDAFLERLTDISPKVRLATVKKVADVLVHHPSLRIDLASHLIDKLRDRDTHVRASTVTAVCDAVLANPDTVTEEVLAATGQRLRDKRPEVRDAAFDGLCAIFEAQAEQYGGGLGGPFPWRASDAASSATIGAEDDLGAQVALGPHFYARFGWIPDHLISLYKPVADQDLKARIDDFVDAVVLGGEENRSPDARARALTRVSAVLTDGGHLGLEGLIKERKVAQTLAVRYATLRGRAKKEAGKDVTVAAVVAELNLLAEAVAPGSEPVRAALEEFNTLKDNKIFKAFEAVVNSESDLHTILAGRAELEKRLATRPAVADALDLVCTKAANMIAPPDVVVALFEVLEGAALSVASAPAAPAGMDYVSTAASPPVRTKNRRRTTDGAHEDDDNFGDGDDGLRAMTASRVAGACRQLAVQLARLTPSSFVDCFGGVARLILSDSQISINAALEIMVHCGDWLAPHPNDTDEDALADRVFDRLHSLALAGTPDQAAAVVRILAALHTRGGLARAEVLSTALAAAVEAHSGGGDGTVLPPPLATVLAGLRELVVCFPRLVEDVVDLVVAFVLDDVIKASHPAGFGPDGADDPDSASVLNRDWDDVSPDCQMRVAGLAVLASYVEGVAYKAQLRFGETPAHDGAAKRAIERRFLETCVPLVDLLVNTIEADGSVPGLELTEWDAAHIRLACAELLLGLGCVPLVENRILRKKTEVMQALALVVQDPEFEVRTRVAQEIGVRVSSATGRLVGPVTAALSGQIGSVAALRLPLSYLPVLALAAIDPERDNVDQAKAIVRDAFVLARQRARSMPANKAYLVLPEYTLPHLIHLLAHTPDFDVSDPEELNLYWSYVTLYVNALADTGREEDEARPLLLQLIAHIRQTTDRTDPANTPVVYAVCELVERNLGRKRLLRRGDEGSDAAFAASIRLPGYLFAQITDTPPKHPRTYLRAGWRPPADSTTERERILASPAKSGASATPSKAKKAKKVRKSSKKGAKKVPTPSKKNRRQSSPVAPTRASLARRAKQGDISYRDDDDDVVDDDGDSDDDNRGPRSPRKRTKGSEEDGSPPTKRRKPSPSGADSDSSGSFGGGVQTRRRSRR